MAVDRTRDGDGLLGLKIVVAVLGVLIVIGTTVVAGTMVARLYAKKGPAPIGTPIGAPTAVAPLAAATVLLPGEHIAGIAAAGGYIAVWIDGPKGTRIEAIDPETGTAHLLLTGP